MDYSEIDSASITGPWLDGVREDVEKCQSKCELQGWSNESQLICALKNTDVIADSRQEMETLESWLVNGMVHPFFFFLFSSLIRVYSLFGAIC